LRGRGNKATKLFHADPLCSLHQGDAPAVQLEGKPAGHFRPFLYCITDTLHEYVVAGLSAVLSAFRLQAKIIETFSSAAAFVQTQKMQVSEANAMAVIIAAM
jgi:hypothetical protein